MIGALMLVLANSTSVQKEGPISWFSSIPRGDDIAVTIHMEGCFDCRTDFLLFHQGSKLMVTAFAGNPKFVDVKRVGSMTLSNLDLAGLDRLLNYYRTLRKGGCNLVFDVTMTQLRAGKQVAQEVFRDATCDLDQEVQRQKMVDPYDLIRRCINAGN